jgi:hypothetical protein
VDNKDKKPDNPFYLEAVATFGVPVRTCDHLHYMQAAGNYLDDYLTKFEEPDKRYGGAIPLRGTHGSGKTHLLSWLGRASERPRSAPTVLYAKADRASFFDLFSQMINQLPQERLQHLIGEGLQQLALETTGKAKMTADLKNRIHTPADVATLADEGNLDRQELLNVLSDRLERRMRENQVSPEIPRALLKVDSPTLGERAYQWLQGKRVDGLQDLGLAHHLGELAQDSEGSSVPDLAAIDALETIAALHQFANRPLVLLVDQLEVFVRDVDKERQKMLSSLIKKLMEHLGRQNALMFLAGTDDAWESLPRDVSPRLRDREPLRVGSLDLEETRILVEVFTNDTPRFCSDSITTIYQLSGGNTREIIRIGYQAFERLGGFLNKATREDLVASASASGTVADRERIALSMSDGILGTFGTVSLNLDVGGQITLDRLLLVGTKPTLALVTVKATDQLSEVQSARRVPAVVAYLEQTWPKLPLIVVTIGYSSSPVAELLGRAGAVIEFEEETFPGRLRARVVELLSQQEEKSKTEAQKQPPADAAVLQALQQLSSRIEQRNTSAPALVDPKLVDMLQRLSARLDDLEVGRRADVEKVAQTFSQRTLEHARPELEKRELRSKWDLLDALQSLEGVLHHGPDLWTERQIVRSILVANEAYLKLNYLDQLGGIYLDLISQEQSGSGETMRARGRLILEMRRVLRDRTLLDLMVTDPRKYSAFAAVAGCLLYVICLTTWRDSFGMRTDLVRLAWQGAAFGAFVGVYAFFMLNLMRRSRARKWGGPKQSS